ncbi:hypothetical protein, partial [Vibrio harveyi]
PCSYREKNKKAPYFRYDEVHAPNCSTRRNLFSSKSNTSKEGSHFCTYINELNIPDIKSNNKNTYSSKKAYKAPQLSQEELDSKRGDGKRSRYLDAVIDFYLTQTEEAKNQPIKLPKHSPKTYREAFQLITNDNEYHSGHIFYAKVHFYKSSNNE